MKAPPFAYARPVALPEVLTLLQRHGGDARLLAGGQSLMPTLNMRLAAPTVLIDITRLRELAGIRVVEGEVHIGALTTHAEIAASSLIREHLPLLSDAARHIAHPAIRNCGTFGGSLALADPAAEWPACCVALDAQIVLAGADGTRKVPAREFFLGLYSTAMQEQEVLTEVHLPIPPAGTRHAFVELARRHGDYAIVGIAALAQHANGQLSGVRLVYLGASDKPVHAIKSSQVFDFKSFSESALSEAQTALADELAPLPDLYHSAATKLHLARVLTARVMKQLAA
jgi:carbon-monoxide dehydrogenase medium subunit